MFKLIPVLSQDAIAELREIAANSTFVDGRVSNPHSKVKNNLQLHEPRGFERGVQIMRESLLASEEFRDFAFPAALAPPILTKYEPGMHYGAHADAAMLFLPKGVVRSDLSCTIFLNEPDCYDGGALRISLGDGELAFKESPGVAVVYPSTTLHRVEPVTRGERLVGLTFIQSMVPDTEQRNLLYELNEVAALEGLKMSQENFARLQAVRENLKRRWSDKP